MAAPSSAKVAKQVEDFIATGAVASLTLARYADPDNPFAGLSYVASEVVYHACGGMSSGLRMWILRTGEKEIHCFLRDATGKVIDPTARKYPKKVDYSTAVASSFISTQPSRRAKQLANLAGVAI
jgi:hypothetical protein